MRYVAPSGDDMGNECSVATNPCRTIGHAILSSYGGDTIVAAAGAYDEGNLLIDKDLTVQGAGPELTRVGASSALPFKQAISTIELVEHTADLLRKRQKPPALFSSGNANKDHIFVIDDGAKVHIKGLTIQGGGYYDNLKGGGILNSGDLMLTDAIVRDNVANSMTLRGNPQGGGIWNGGNLTLMMTVIKDNASFGGHTYGGEGGGIWNDGYLEVHDTLSRTIEQ